jgi:hypothetical protein
MPEARFRLPHRPGEDGKEINLVMDFLNLLPQSLISSRLLALEEKWRGHFARGAMRKTVAM